MESFLWNNIATDKQCSDVIVPPPHILMLLLNSEMTCHISAAMKCETFNLVQSYIQVKSFFFPNWQAGIL